MTTPGDSKEVQFMTETFKFRMDLANKIATHKRELASILAKKTVTTDDKIQELRQYVLSMKAETVDIETVNVNLDFATQVKEMTQGLTLLTTAHIKMLEQALRQTMEPAQEFHAWITAIGAILADKSLNDQQKIRDIEDVVLTA